MRLPRELTQEIERLAGPIEEVRPVGGGCVSSAARLSVAGRSLMLKHDSAAPPAFFSVEAAGLRELAEADSGLRIPSVLGTAAPDGGLDWILMEWLDHADPTPASSRSLGIGLARMHRAGEGGWGWNRDGYIGSLPQNNSAADSWADFWWTRRLQPQLARSGSGPPGGAAWRRLAGVLPDLLAPAEDEGPSLLHGDLWGGNVIHSTEGPALVDPACYRGHREVDLAMSELFGGFSPAFYEAYQTEWPLASGWRVRRNIYQLYYLLVHVNLFGSSYWSRTASTLTAVLEACSDV